MSKLDKSNEPSQDTVTDNDPVAYTKSDYIRAKAIIASYRETQKNKPKRQCSEKQLAALKAGREKAMANRANKIKSSSGDKK